MAKQGSEKCVDHPDPAAIGAARMTSTPASYLRLLFLGTLGPDVLPDYGQPPRFSIPNHNSNSNSKMAFECIRFPRDLEVSVSHFIFFPDGVDTFASSPLNSYQGQTSAGRFDVIVHFVLGNTADDLGLNDFKAQAHSQTQADVSINSFACAYNSDNGISTFYPDLPENLACKMIIVEGSFHALTLAVYGIPRKVKDLRPSHSRKHTGDDFHCDLPPIAEVTKEEIPRPDLDMLGRLIEKSNQITKYVWVIPEVTNSEPVRIDHVNYSDVIRLVNDINSDNLSNRLRQVEDAITPCSNLNVHHATSNNQLVESVLGLFRRIRDKSFGPVDAETQNLLFTALGNVGIRTGSIAVVDVLLESLQFSQDSHSRLLHLQAIAKCMQHPKVTLEIYHGSDSALSIHILPILNLPGIRQDVKDIICQIVDICDLHNAITELASFPTQSFQVINYHLCKNIDFSARQNHKPLLQAIISFLYSCSTTFIEFYVTGQHVTTVEQIVEFIVLLSQTSQGLDFLSHISISIKQQSVTEQINLLSYLQSIPSFNNVSEVTPVPLSGHGKASKQQLTSLIFTLVQGSKLVKCFSCLGDDINNQLDKKRLILAMRKFGHSYLERQSLANAFVVHEKSDMLLKCLSNSSEALDIMAWVFEDMRSFELFSTLECAALNSIASNDVHLEAFLYILEGYRDYGIKSLLGLLREQRDIPSCYGDTLSILKLRYAVSFIFYKCLKVQGLAEVLEYETADYGTADYGNCLMTHLLQYVDHAVTVIRRDEAVEMEKSVTWLVNVRKRHGELKLLCSIVLHLARNIMVLIYNSCDSMVSKRHWIQSDVNEFNKENLMPSRRQTMTRTIARCVFSLVTVLDDENDTDVLSSAQMFLGQLTEIAIKDAKPLPVFFSAHAISLVAAELVAGCNNNPLSAPRILQVCTELFPSADKKLECKLWSEQLAAFAFDISDILIQWFQSLSNSVTSTLQEFVYCAVRIDMDNFAFTKLIMDRLMGQIKERAKHGFADVGTAHYSFLDIVHLRAGLHFLRTILMAVDKSQEVIMLANQHSLLPLLRAVDKDGGSTSVLEVISKALSLFDPLVESEQVDGQELLSRYLNCRLSSNVRSVTTSPIAPGGFGMSYIQQQAPPFISMKNQNDNSRKNLGGGKAYLRNEFRSIHINRKANTSRPPSVHVDDFLVGNIPQNQHHPETPVDVQSLTARRFEQDATIAAAVARQQKFTTDIGMMNPSNVFPYPSQRLVNETFPFVTESIRGTPAVYPVGMQPVEWNTGGNTSNSLHME